ncbi:hypothetical protein PORY_001151 [Pneumocystis oryctolagi]|uniref:Uncharacterized protein n=1 Tax=Pneumocystis oryctolagi TaxID=42067 RepID=A0ACB7CDZ7_9ASCO|nr:hypothetical protein PORY_001151 [Pneumocystis oryctolagi]
MQKDDTNISSKFAISQTPKETSISKNIFSKAREFFSPLAWKQSSYQSSQNKIQDQFLDSKNEEENHVEVHNHNFFQKNVMEHNIFEKIENNKFKEHEISSKVSSEMFSENNMDAFPVNLNTKIESTLSNKMSTPNEILSSFFSQKGNSPLNTVEIEGVISLMSKNAMSNIDFSSFVTPLRTSQQSTFSIPNSSSTPTFDSSVKFGSCIPTFSRSRTHSTFGPTISTPFRRRKFTQRSSFRMNDTSKNLFPSKYDLLATIEINENQNNKSEFDIQSVLSPYASPSTPRRATYLKHGSNLNAVNQKKKHKSVAEKIEETIHSNMLSSHVDRKNIQNIETPYKKYKPVISSNLQNVVSIETDNETDLKDNNLRTDSTKNYINTLSKLPISKNLITEEVFSENRNSTLQAFKNDEKISTLPTHAFAFKLSNDNESSSICSLGNLDKYIFIPSDFLIQDERFQGTSDIYSLNQKSYLAEETLCASNKSLKHKILKVIDPNLLPKFPFSILSSKEVKNKIKNILLVPEIQLHKYVFTSSVYFWGFLLKLGICYDFQILTTRSESIKKIARNFPVQETLDDSNKFLFFIALILGKNHNNPKVCKEVLEKRCKELKNSITVLNSACKDPESLCNSLNANNYIESAYKKLIKDLEKILKLKYPTNNDCLKLETTCFFLEGTSVNSLSELCNELRNICYKKKRENIADAILLVALRESLNTYESCRENIRKYCSILDLRSDELMRKCLWKEQTCLYLLNIVKKKCTSLEKNVQSANNRKLLEVICLQLFYECGIYSPNCKGIETIKNFQKPCIGNDKECFVSHISDMSIYNYFPFDFKISLEKTLDLFGIYSYAASRGVIISERAAFPKIDYLLALLIQDIALDYDSPDPQKDKCEILLKNNCTFLNDISSDFHIECKKASDRNLEKTICKKLKKKLEKYCIILRDTLTNKGLGYNVDNYGIKYTKIIPWIELNTNALTEEECLILQSECYYLEQNCYGMLKHPCNNLRALCYKKSRDALVMRMIETMFHKNSNETLIDKPLEHCIKFLLKKHSDMSQNEDLVEKVIFPNKTCKELVNIVENQCISTRNILINLNDFKTKSCEILISQCKRLVQECYIVLKDLCNALYNNCEFVNRMSQLKILMLGEMSDSLRNQSSCEKKLKDICLFSEYSKNKTIAYSCGNRKNSCVFIVKQVQEHCIHFKNHMEKSKIITSAEKNKIDRNKCIIWEIYCAVLRGNCPNILNNECSVLRKACASFVNLPKPIPIPTTKSTSKSSSNEPTDTIKTEDVDRTKTEDVDRTKTKDGDRTKTEDGDRIKGTGQKIEKFQRKIICLIAGVILGILFIIWY